jgi:hypothetical protein
MANYRKKKFPSFSAVTIPPTQPIESRGLRVSEVSAYTRATICAIRAAIKSGALPAILLGKRHVILREDADAWLSSLRAAVR